MRTSSFWRFQLIFWFIAGIALFLSGVTQMPVLQATVRNFFLFIAGFVGSFFLAYLIDELRWMNLLRLRLTAYASAYVLALLCVVAINAITFTLRGTALGDMTFGQWFSGTLNLALICAFWSELFIQRIYGSATDLDTAPAQSDKLVVNSGNEIVQVPLRDILCITAAGDYVEVQTATKTYLDRNSLSHIAEALRDELFLRVHRSKIVNRQHVESVTALSKGRYSLNLSDGSTLATSRGYKADVEDALLAGIT